MKAVLEAGCVALVIDSVNPENIGKSVTLISWCAAGELFNAPDGTCARMPANTGGWLCAGEIVCGGKMSVSMRDFRRYGWCVFLPQYLMPMNGDPFWHLYDGHKELYNT